MKAMILAAGLGSRMRPLTDHTPKPLLNAGGKPLLVHHIERLAQAGFSELVINVSHLGQQIVSYCGDGSRWGVSIAISTEVEPLETAGGIVQALPLLGDEPFVVINGDIWTDYPLARLKTLLSLLEGQAHLVMVDSPPQHPLGDFLLDEGGRVKVRSAQAVGLTYAGIGVYSAGFFAGIAPGRLALRPLLDTAITRERLLGEHFQGQWEDIGTPERLAALNQRLQV